MINVTVRSAMHIAEALGGRRIEVALGEKADLSVLFAYLSETYGDAFRERIYKKDGSIKNGFFSVLLNGRSIFALEGFNCALKEGDDVVILPAISGG